MDSYADLRRDNLDLIFIGGFSRHHAQRIAALKAAASTAGIRARLHFEDSRLTRLANLLPFVPGLASYRHPKEIRVIRAGPLYGRDLYAALGSTKVVLNGAVDMAGEDRGNMRCFEATGCGALLLTDSGVYPDGFVDQETMVVYSSPDQIPGLLKRLIGDVSWRNAIAKAGGAMVRDRYSKDRQWAKFRELV
jgi:Glycosyl transferases group 1